MRCGIHFGRSRLAVLLIITLIWSGCSTNWIREAEQIVAVLIPAATNVVALVAAFEGHGVSSADVQRVQNLGTQAGADLQLIQSLIAAYQKADEATKPGILNQIQSAIQAAQGNLQGLLQGLHIKDTAMQAKITAVVGIVLVEVESLAAVVPLVRGEAAGSKTLAGLRPADSRGRLSPHSPLTAVQFVTAYNSTLTAKTGNGELDRAAGGLVIHSRSWWR